MNLRSITPAHLRKWFLQGFALAAPVLLTLAILIWLAGLIESFLGELLKAFIPDAAYLPGMGLLLGLSLILGFGILANHYLIRRLVDFAEQQMDRIPMVKNLLQGIKDVSKMLVNKREEGNGKVVSVDLGGFQLVGFVMQAEAFLHGAETGEAPLMAVYLPMSYQIGGYTLYVPRDRVTALDVTAEDAMRAILTGGQMTRPATSTPAYVQAPPPGVHGDNRVRRSELASSNPDTGSSGNLGNL